MRLVLIVAAGVLLAGANASAQGDPVRGKVAFQKCYACHSVEPGERGLAAPNLRGVVGRPVAGVPGFAYSAALRSLKRREPVWTAELIDRYVADSESVAPGTTMPFLGMTNARERADLIAYLRATGS